MHSLYHSCITVKDVDAAQRMAIELLRNTLVAYQRANILVIGAESWPKLRYFLVNEAPRYGATTDRNRGHWDICIVGRTEVSSVAGQVRLTVALPDAHSAIAAERRIELSVGAPAGEVVVVPGTAHVINGSHVLTAETFGRLKRAELIAGRKRIRAVILSGWNGRIGHCQSEAAQMLAGWRGPHVPIILDEAARTTAENALWSASFTTALGGVRKVRMVTAWVSALRLGLAALIAFRSTRVLPVLSIVWGRVQAASWHPAFMGLIHLRRHIRVGRAFIANGTCHREV